MDRKILHCDLNGFFASVEALYYPDLNQHPMAVCGDVKNRHGIILAKNELAKAYHIQTAEPVWQAVQKCPCLKLIPPHFERYVYFSRKVQEIYLRYTDQVEAFGIDECWLDVTESYHLFAKSAEDLAFIIKETVKSELSLTISVGVSFNKIFAKLGSDYKKPDALTKITRENFPEKVFPLDICNLLFVGKSAQKTLHRFGIHTIGDLANFDRQILLTHLGKSGGIIHDYANGLDSSRVRYFYEKEEAKSIGKGKTFPMDICGEDKIHDSIIDLTGHVAHSLRKNRLKCDVLSVTIKNPDFKSIVRQKHLSSPTCISQDILEASMNIIKSTWKMNLPIRMITITATHLVSQNCGIQTCLFDSSNDIKKQKQEKIEFLLDDLRAKYGKTIFSFNHQQKK